MTENRLAIWIYTNIYSFYSFDPLHGFKSEICNTSGGGILEDSKGPCCKQMQTAAFSCIMFYLYLLLKSGSLEFQVASNFQANFLPSCCSLVLEQSHCWLSNTSRAPLTPCLSVQTVLGMGSATIPHAYCELTVAFSASFCYTVNGTCKIPGYVLAH